jgi:DNA-binding NarL/FixJ family response regulator
MARNGNGSGTGNGKADGAARKPITVLIVDDERTFGEALEVALDREKDLRVIHVATDGLDAVASATEYQPDVVLMDASMPGMNGLEATRRIKQCDPDAAVVILSGHDDEYMLARAVQAGAVGLLRKTQAVGDVASTVRRAHRGEAIHDQGEVERAQRRLRHRRDVDGDVRGRLERLTPRELEILEAMTAGLSNREIGERLFVSENTVKTHASRLFEKLGASRRTQAVQIAKQRGLIA